MDFNPNRSKQAQEVIFSMKLPKANHSPVYFNYNPINKFPLRNILECVLILNWIFRNT